MLAAAATVAVAATGLGWHPVVGTPERDQRINLARFVTVQPRKVLQLRDRNQGLLELGGLLSRSSFIGVISQAGISHFSGNSLARSAETMAPTETVKESATGVELSKSLELPGGKGELSLVGVGVREKKITFLNIKVYAVGFYWEASSVSEDASLAPWKGKSEKELSKNVDFFKACAQASLEKGLKLVLVRDVTGNQFWQAFDEALTPRLKAAAAGPDGQEAMDAMGKMFKSRSFQKGTNVLIFWSQPSTLRIDLVSPAEASNANRAAAEPDFTVEAPALLPCLFDIFLGKDSVSPSLKSSIASSFSTT